MKRDRAAVPIAVCALLSAGLSFADKDLKLPKVKPNSTSSILDKFNPKDEALKKPPKKPSKKDRGPEVFLERFSPQPEEERDDRTDRPPPASRFGTNVPSVGPGREADPFPGASPPVTPRSPSPAEHASPSTESSPGLAYGGTARFASEVNVADPLSGGGGENAPPLSRMVSAVAPGRALADPVGLGASKLAAGDFEGAAADAALAVKASPGDPAAYLLQASAMNRAGRFEEAGKAALRVLRLKGADPRALSEAYRELAWAQLGQGKYRDAAASAGTALELAPGNTKALLARAFAYEQLGERSKMLADLEAAAARDPGYRGHLQLAREGRTLFQPGSKENWRLLDALSGEPPPRRFPVRIAALALLVLASILGAAWKLKRRPASAAAEPAETPLIEPGEEAALLGGKYALGRSIGRGSSGEVREAQDRALQRPVAVKKMSVQGPKAREACVREAQSLASIRHPNIVDVYEVLDLPAGLYIVFELLSGKSVRQILAEKRLFSLDQARQVLRPVCAALDFAHSHSILHRDLKTSDIMLTDGGYVKVLDFGLNRATAVPEAAGGGAPRQEVPLHRAPEAMSDAASPAADVYSLAVCVYEMVTGESPMRGAGKRREYVPAVLRVPGLTPAFDELVRRSLDPEPSKRPVSVKEFLAAMEALS